jgi:hypothetical protein
MKNGSKVIKQTPAWMGGWMDGFMDVKASLRLQTFRQQT